jgi:uncharacterized membrane protein YvbJ
MKCSKCGTENPKDSEYCLECGELLKNEENLIQNNKIPKTNWTIIIVPAYLILVILIALWALFGS